MTGKAVRLPPPSSVTQACRAFQQTAVQVEHVARVRFAARRAAQQQRHLAVGLGVLGKVIIDDQRIPAVFHELLAHGCAGERGQVLQRRRDRRRCAYHVVYSMAPYFSRIPITWATLDCFWPMAT